MRTVVALVRCSHPLPCAAITAFCVAVALSAGAGPRAALVGAVVLSGQTSIGWSNDVVDLARDRAAARADKPLATGHVARRVVGVAAGAALLLSLALGFVLGVAAGVVNAVALAAGWAYNLWLKPTVLSPVPYVVHFGLVPAWLVAASLPMATTPRPRVAAAAALLGVAAHFTNTLPDTAADRATGVRGLPQRVGPAVSAAVSSGLLLGAGALLVGVPGNGLATALSVAGVAAAALYAVLVNGPRPVRDRRIFHVALVVVALLVASFVASGQHLAARS